MGLTRKKITVRTKKGKTFQRSVMVRAEAIGKRAGGKKLNSLNPWETHHTEHVKGEFPKSSGSSGPGSNWSAHAFLVHQAKIFHKERFERGWDGGQAHARQVAEARRKAGQEGAQLASALRGHYGSASNSLIGRYDLGYTHRPDEPSHNSQRAETRRRDLAEAFGVHHERVEHSTRRNNGTW